MYARFATTDTWDKDANAALVHGYYGLMTRYRWFQMDAHHVLRAAGPVSAAKPLPVSEVSEPSSAVVRELIRHMSNWLYLLVCLFKNLSPYDTPFHRSEQWWHRFDWFAAMVLLLLPFVPALLAYPFTKNYLGLLALGYYTWFLTHRMFVHDSETWTVLWPTYYVSDLLAIGMFLGVTASHELFALALPSLSGQAEEYTRQ
ncbi:hypothetical protein PG994_003103 [Apiospora phragmitis]|uniref:Uncharacterized protein n=1 Tax=Apiospora phragmitis TaxID=2905665 RepID=A0ABR1W9V4_9PEZI